MFLRKLFKVPDKVRWLGLELLVVFVGVYLAFLFQSYAEQKGINKEKEKVLVSLKKELEQFRIDFPGNASFQKSKLQEWDSLLQAGTLSDYYTWRYLEPQYNFKVIEYAINLQGTDILDFELYEKLLNLYAGISKVQNAERVMTEFSAKFNLIPDGIKETDQVKLLRSQNRFNFFKFRVGANDRASNLEHVARLAATLVSDINKRLGPEMTEKVDFDLLGYYYEYVKDTAYIMETFTKYFPTYDEDLIRVKLSEFSRR